MIEVVFQCGTGGDGMSFIEGVYIEDGGPSGRVRFQDSFQTIDSINLKSLLKII